MTQWTAETGCACCSERIFIVSGQLSHRMVLLLVLEADYKQKQAKHCLYCEYCKSPKIVVAVSCLARWGVWCQLFPSWRRKCSLWRELDVARGHSNHINSVAMYGHCASFSPLHEHTGVQHSLPTYRFFFNYNFLQPLQGVTALNVVFLKRCKQEFLYELFY